MRIDPVPAHPHPCNFRCHRHVDRGWGEIAFEYVWDSTGGGKGERTRENLDLAHCYLYELTRYTGPDGRDCGGYLLLPDPPFVQWKFRNPTDGRTGPVGLERFAAAQGWAWDRHKLPGRLILPTASACAYTILSIQEFRFHCEFCGADAVVPGTDSGPHSIVRTFALKPQEFVASVPTAPVWRYSIRKHGICAWMDWDAQGYVADSAGIGFGPW